MSSEPRFQLIYNDAVVGEFYRNSSGNISLADHNSGSVVDVKNISTGSAQILSMTTSSGQDINQTTTVEWDEHIVGPDSAFSHDASTSQTDITINEAGTYRIYCNLYGNSSNTRTNPSFRFRVNGTEVAGRSGSAYARNADGHAETSTNLEIYQELSSGDTVNVYTFQEANGGTVSLQNRESIFTIEKIVR